MNYIKKVIKITIIIILFLTLLIFFLSFVFGMESRKSFSYIKDDFKAINQEYNNELMFSFAKFMGIYSYNFKIKNKNLNDDEFLLLAFNVLHNFNKKINTNINLELVRYGYSVTIYDNDDEKRLVGLENKGESKEIVTSVYGDYSVMYLFEDYKKRLWVILTDEQKEFIKNKYDFNIIYYDKDLKVDIQTKSDFE